MIVSTWHSMWILLIKVFCNIYIPSLLQDISGNTFAAMEQLGYYSTEDGPVHTRKGLYQDSFQFRTTPDPTAKPMFTIYGKALPRRSEPMLTIYSKALIRALIFIDEALGYKIGDVIKYVDYLLLRNNIR